ncbi:unnamed protein product [Aspergillus oryzae RIB40]|uniref:DNA, SC010 n=1 Tax=Aspergillus oryzae (strain ATCC 42149 / RIB 40) TaxID=510516 RepID=Q2TWC5_ASPOR|nr:unnamed protein product [Aspergillus oryzae RIB40]BAE66448.1 unnamed protein product [Aspergillus oryzae RIB40]
MGAHMQDALVLLPEKQIYPFSWVDDANNASVCQAAWENPTFDPEECKRLMEVEAWPSYFITSWVFWSNLTVLFNKWILDSTEFTILLTTWHLIFATVVTQVLARTTTFLDGRKNIEMNSRLYARTMVPIGLLYSGSLVFGNIVYLYLNISFIQMLKAAGPVVTLLVSWSWGVATPSMEVLINILIITCSVGLAVSGEIQFSLLGIFYQMASLVCDANRLVMMQILLSEDGQKMDPLVSLYYTAPVCAVMNSIIAWNTELRDFHWSVVPNTGYLTLLANAVVGFMLNVSIFVLIGKTSGLTTTLVSIPKNILLIVASVVLWHTHVSTIQIVGYSIALLGLVYYSLGWRTIKSSIENIKAWRKDPARACCGTILFAAYVGALYNVYTIFAYFKGSSMHHFLMQGLEP